ncbi:MAG: 50S ribosomal protein L10, partial [Oscillospiraceae bacterium]|nr:50S ribosomal protein L10 [Oscillospiraceae bacterium]
MASEKILAQKQSYVADLKAKLDASQGGVVFNYGGITVAEDTKLRKELREAGVSYEVVKNTLLKIAIKGTDLEGMSDKLEGTTALAIAGNEDPLAAARILHKFAEASKGKFEIKTGYM